MKITDYKLQETSEYLPKCPYCQHYQKLFEGVDGEDEGKYECDECGKTFTYQVETIDVYSTYAEPFERDV